ncbi:hypothetical protein [Gaetbulibacter jejuensis]|uniref:hypothetical protein n=1 Tax=Gaetbulibacter jejuensis TaxID=584607 RepID=UPI00300B010B
MKKLLFILVLLACFHLSCSSDDSNNTEENETEQILQSVTIDKIVIERFNERGYDPWDPLETCCGNTRPDVAVQVFLENNMLYQSETYENAFSPIIYDVFGNIESQSSNIEIMLSPPLVVENESVVDNSLIVRIVDVDNDDVEVIHTIFGVGSTDTEYYPGVYYMGNMWYESYLGSNIGYSFGVYFTHTFE